MTTTQMAKGVSCWFDVPVENVERAQKFWGELLGWKFDTWEESPIPFWTISPQGGSIDVPAKGGEMIGGMMQRQQPGGGIVPYFLIENCAASAEKVKQLGGKVTVETMPVGDFGYMAHCLDTEGNAFALWEANADAQ